jgi:hypothetical protein
MGEQRDWIGCDDDLVTISDDSGWPINKLDKLAISGTGKHTQTRNEPCPRPEVEFCLRGNSRFRAGLGITNRPVVASPRLFIKAGFPCKKQFVGINPFNVIHRKTVFSH